MLTVRNLLLVGHIAGVVLLVGPATVSASLFPRRALAALEGDTSQAAVAGLLHRISRSYGVSSLVVPALGLALASESSFWSATWLHVSIGLYAVSAGLLIAVLIPTQGRVIEALERPELHEHGLADARRLHGITGAFSVLWMAVLVLMVVKPW